MVVYIVGKVSDKIEAAIQKRKRRRRRKKRSSSW